MKYFKSLLTMLLVGLSFTACNEYEDFDKEANTVNYPSREALSLGHYRSTYTANSEYEYDVVLTQNTLGDTVAYVLMTGKPDTDEAGMVRTIAVAGDVQYNDSLGMLTAVAPEEASFYEEETSVVMAYKADLKTITLSLNYGGEMVATHVSKVSEIPPFYGIFYGVPEGSESNNYELGINIMQTPAALEDGTEYNALIASLSGTEPAVYAIEGDVLTVTGLFSGSVYTLQYNEICQLVATDAAGKKYFLDAERSEPEPETFEAYATGRYVHGVQSSIFVTAFGSDVPNMLGRYLPESNYEATLYQSTRKPNRFIIDPWATGYDALYFIVDTETNEIEVPGSYTGFTGETGKDIMVLDCYSMLGEYKSVYDPDAGSFDFYLVLTDFVYYYGVDADQYIITGEASGVQRKTIKKDGTPVEEKGDPIKTFAVKKR